MDSQDTRLSRTRVFIVDDHPLVREGLKRLIEAEPTLVLAGQEDPATTGEMMRELAEGISGAEFVVVPGAAHLPNATHPDVVNAALRDHLMG